MKKKYRIYRDPNKTWWVDSIIPGLDTLWVSDYRISPVQITIGQGRDYATDIKYFLLQRWNQAVGGWSTVGRPKTWLDAIAMVAYRERQVAQSTEEGHVHHLEACS